MSTPTIAQPLCECPLAPVSMMSLVTSAGTPRLSPSWTCISIFSVLTLISLLASPAKAQLGLSFFETSDYRVECGPVVGNAPSAPVGDQYLADADNCNKIADKNHDEAGYWKTFE
ncbi:hypothetical protein F5Y19DRAFT_479270 [Xylariaceae sp. FL1651]|nr:hypothetical protein F5Y19DRAFT_479270 [Xylariaceae sp. FL1651]